MHERNNAPMKEPLDRKTIGKDLIVSMFNGVPGNSQINGKYADVVTSKGTAKVYTREVVRTKAGTLVATVSPSELNYLNFANPKDKPDFVLFVVFNSFRGTVDVFRFYPKELASGQWGWGNCSVCFSELKHSYRSKEHCLVASYPA